MSDYILKCNNIQCRLPLAHKEEACVTKCSHIFCNACATSIFHASSICPACQTVMDSPNDIMSVSLALTDEYKSVVLAGLSPAVIMDICSRAMSFWTYQATQELQFQQAAAENQKEKLRVTESRASSAITNIREKLKLAEGKLGSMHKTLNSERQERAVVEDLVEERNRQMRSLKAAYENLRQKLVPAQMSYAAASAHQDNYQEDGSNMLPKGKGHGCGPAAAATGVANSLSNGNRLFSPNICPIDQTSATFNPRNNIRRTSLLSPPRSSLFSGQRGVGDGNCGWGH